MNKSDSYFRALDQAGGRADSRRALAPFVIQYISCWYRDEDGDVISTFIATPKPWRKPFQASEGTLAILRARK